MKFILNEININKEIGASFCHVIRIRELVQEIPSIKFGNQKWNGLAPIFNRRARRRISIIGLIFFRRSDSNLRWEDKIIEQKINTIEPTTCTKKYLKLASLLICL